MPRNEGLFKKFDVKRIDGQPEREGATYFTLDVRNDPHAFMALVAYRDSVYEVGGLPKLAQALDELIGEVSVGEWDGPQMRALRTPKGGGA